LSKAVKGSGWLRAALWLLACLVLLGLILASAQLRDLLVEAANRVTALSVVATMPAQAAATLLCAAALWVLRPGVGYFGCLGSRLLRDASGNLPVAFPGFSSGMGARALVLAGGQTRAAIAASALDKVAEIVAQIPYICLAVFVLWYELHLPELPVGMILPILTGVVVAGLGTAALWLRFGAGSQLATRLAGEARNLAAEAGRQRAGLPAFLVLHFLAWLSGGVQIWMAAQALGYDLGLYEAIAIESAAYAGRALFFFVPAGLVAQEASLVAAGLVFGLAAPQSLALGLVLRLRDAVLALPLLLWPLFEYRGRRPRISPEA
jgi:hypothetical protein